MRELERFFRAFYRFWFPRSGSVWADLQPPVFFLAGCWAALGLALRLVGELASALDHGTSSGMGVLDSLVLPARVLGDPFHPQRAWAPLPLAETPGFIWWTALLMWLVVVGCAGYGLSRLPDLRMPHRHLVKTAETKKGAQWATKARELLPILVAPGKATPGRFVCGSARLSGLQRRTWEVRTEPGASVLVLGPPGTGKTTALLEKALLSEDWAHANVVALSVKDDLLEHTLAWRRRCGAVSSMDPTGAAQQYEPPCRWSPLDAASTWRGALRVAESLCSTNTASGTGDGADSAFFNAAGQKALAPMLLAARLSGAYFAQVMRWVSRYEEAAVEVAAILESNGEELAADAWASMVMTGDEKTRGNVFLTIGTKLNAYQDPGVLETTETYSPEEVFDAEAFVAGRGGTHYVVAPAHDQERLAPLFAAQLTEIINAAYEEARRHPGGRLPVPLLLLLDEAANICPVRGLGKILTTARSIGLVVITAFHDVSQLEAAYGKSAQTILNASRCRIVLPGSFDEKTLKLISEVAGEALVERKSTSKSDEAGSHRSVSKAKQQTKLASRGQVRELRKGSALVFYGNLPPVPVKLLPFYEDPAALARSRGELPEVSVPEQGHEVAPEPAP